jgi:hypothetical protein
MEFHEEATFDEWMEHKGPSSDREQAKRTRRAG